jgi:hypothetical protein
MALDEAAQRGLELWSIYGFAVLFTGLRMVARIRIAGWRHLQADDYLACTALVRATMAVVEYFIC